MSIVFEKDKKQNLNFVLFIILIGFLTYWSYAPVLNNKFTNWDDPNYVTESPYINLIERGDYKPYFTENHMGNYHPFSLISLSLDYQLDKYNPLPYHRTNLILHILNSFLVFLLIYRLLGNSYTAFFTALLFGVHPIHAESVAWIAERKDVLFTFFFLISLWFYAGFAKDKNYVYYGLSLVLFIFSLLSKGMAVSLAPTLVLVDYFYERNIKSTRVILEKVPFFLLALFFGILAVYAQSLGPDTEGIPDYNLFKRLVFAGYGCSQYVLKLLWPYDLVAFYPYPRAEIPFYYYIASIAVTVFFTCLVIFFRTNKIIIFSVFFFILNILLVLQILPVGKALMADRYAYLPSIGFFLLLVFATERALSFKKGYLVAGGILSFYILCLGVYNYKQVQVWKDSVSLWNYAIDHIPSDVAYNNRGVEFNRSGEYNQAIEDFNKALEFNPSHKEAYNNLGVALANLGKNKEAISAYDNALKIQPNYVNALYNRGNSYAKLNKAKIALKDYDQVLKLDPKYLSVYNNRGLVLKSLGRLNDALNDFDKAILLDPFNADAYSNRSLIKYALNDINGAMEDNQKAISINPNVTASYLHSGIAKCRVNDFKGALEDFDKAIAINPSDKEVYLNRGITYYHIQSLDFALKDYNKAIELDSSYGEALLNRGILKANTGNINGALKDYAKAIVFIPDNPLVYGNRAILRFASNDFKGVIEDLNKAILLDSAYADAYCNRGLAKANQGDKEGAMKDYNKALELNKSFGLAYNNRGVLRYQSGDKKGGCEDWHEALKLNFEGSKAFIQAYCK
ncbi:tetratricopeptide TPR_2 repeat protein [Sporocytophaga myxococcoides]|uniref:Tetratricopeptide TPR_2 repeat protein n=1 Tax=Sporocytophaga myxococcoides TaxID=153721 RepID=A0A098LGX4_9BACT|nr:tetratricopeptide repeat protein [Sporocytophaga myxococcoides]GAL85298.1 tetratricopeptide TPR_2 repeat protein [Sporocytophaga myxococcoides]